MENLPGCKDVFPKFVMLENEETFQEQKKYYSLQAMRDK